MRIIFVFLFASLVFNNLAYSQANTIDKSHQVYHLNYYVDVPITVAGLLASKYGTDYLRGRDPKNPDRIATLSPNDVWWFDRGATRQNPAKAGDYINTSNLFMRSSMFVPVFMLLDADVRAIWHDYTLLYLEAQSINAAAYLAAAIPVSRLRPFMYNPDEPMVRKTGRNTTNAFFSGHASVVATSTFFMVKVYYDLHPEAQNRLLWYGLATIPPAITGYCRYKAAKHFPTDILTGMVVGALTGVLVPEWHKKNEGKYAFYPTYNGQTAGVYAQFKF